MKEIQIRFSCSAEFQKNISTDRIKEMVPEATDVRISDSFVFLTVPDSFILSDEIRDKIAVYCSSEELMTEPNPSESESDQSFKFRKVSVYSLVVSIIAAIVVSSMLTLSLSVPAFKKQINQLKAQDAETVPSEEEETGKTIDIADRVRILDNLFAENYYFYGDIDREMLSDKLLKSYIDIIGDDYGEYFNPEEYENFISDNSGSNVGIGISFQYSDLEIDGRTLKVFRVVAVYKNSPAFESGVQIDDCIAYIGSGDNRELISDVEYEYAVSKMRGEKGTVADFALYRKSADGYKLVEFSVTRSDYQVDSVSGHVYGQDGSVGIVEISQFQLITPKQFKETVDDLISKGCNQFVFDLRNNPGGAVRSVQTILSYFLNEGDLVLSTESSIGEKDEYLAKAYSGSGDLAGCSITSDEIGIYKGLKCIVIVNGNTASAAELFTATLRDYGLAQVVGTTTYGKGCMQNTYSTASKGLPGGVKITTRMYFSKSHTVYHGIGIEPDVTVDLSEEAKLKNFYTLDDTEDDQLITAIHNLKNK